MDKSISDADFDSYWLDESRNKNRNRIRVGRQYQATVPPLLKPGETDGRRCEDLETLKWKPDYELSEEQLDHYLSVAKAVSLFARAINVYQKADAPRCLQSALRGLSEFVTSHHPCHHDAGCKVPNESSSSMSASASLQSVTASPLNSDSKAGGASSSAVLGNLGRCEWTPQEADLFAKALEVCGKNFGAIKKEFLPWKPVKSIIEFYYCGKGDIKPTGDSKSPPPSNSECDQQASASTKTECKSNSPPLSPILNPSQSSSTAEITHVVPEEEGKDEKLLDREDKKCNLADINFTVTKVETVENMVPPPSTHLSRTVASSSPVKGEQKSASVSEDQSDSTMGSLKFYLGGQLVLKLNAQQEGRKEGAAKCQWVQSVDTPKLLSQTKRLQKHRKKGFELKKDDGTRSADSHTKYPEGSSSPSDRDGTDSERSHTPDVFQAKKAKVKCYPTSSSASSIASCSSMPRLSPKPPWTPPVEMLKWDKSPSSHQSDEGFAEGSSPKVKQETQGRLKSDYSRASPVSTAQRMSPDSGYSYMMPKTKSFGKNNDLMTTGLPVGMNILPKCSVFGENDIRNYNRGSKLQAVLLNKEVREGGSVLAPKSVWHPGRSSPMAHPATSSPVTFSRTADEVPLDLSSKKIVVTASNNPVKIGVEANDFRMSPIARPLSPSSQQGVTGYYRNMSILSPLVSSASSHCSTSGQPSPLADECRGNGSASATWEGEVRNGKELSVQPNDEINVGVGRKKSKKCSTSAER